MTTELLALIQDPNRSRIPEDRIVTADEVAEWEKGTLGRLLTDGALQELKPANSLVCDACDEGHTELVQVIEEPPGTRPRHYISCPEFGRVHVDPLRLRRWQIGPVDSEPNPQASGIPAPSGGFRHSEDYTYAAVYGFEFRLSLRQAKVVEMLHAAQRSGAPDLRSSQILTRLDSDGQGARRIHDVFKGVDDWQELIARPKRGFYRLNV